VCDEVAILDHGRLVTQGSVAALRQQYGGSSSRYALEVDGDATSLRAQLDLEPWVDRIRDADAGVEISVTDVDAARHRVPVMVADSGLGLVRFEPVEMSLEDVFVALVERAA